MIKKLLILTLFILGISSCVDQVTYKRSSLRTEVTDKQLHKEFDTLLVIKEGEEYHIFNNKTNNYIASTYGDCTEYIIFCIVVFTLIGIYIGWNCCKDFRD